MFYFDWTFVLLIPALLLAVWAQSKVKLTYAKYSEIAVRSGMTGAEVAQHILQDANVTVDDGRTGRRTVPVQPIPGELTDHYDPRTRELRLSEGVYYGRSIAALGVAAHEAGHAIQHAHMYGPLALRNLIYPVSSIGSSMAIPLFFIGLLFAIPALLKAGILLFSLAVVFTLITLPVEFNASRRALRVLADGRYLDQDELAGARKVLTAAALTYVAAALMAVLQLLRLLILSRSRD
jgi:Zn-dependent membrane protease YugP